MREIQSLDPWDTASNGSAKARSPNDDEDQPSMSVEEHTCLERKTSLTNDVKGQPVPGQGCVDRLLAVLSEVLELLNKKIDIVVDDLFLVTKGTRAEGVGQGLSLLAVDNGVSDAHDARLLVCGIVFGIVPLVLEEPFLAMLDVAIYIFVGLDGGKRKQVWARADDVSLGVVQLPGFPGGQGQKD